MLVFARNLGSLSGAERGFIVNARNVKMLLLVAIVAITGCDVSSSPSAGGTGGTAGTGGTGGSSSACQTVATSPGTWDFLFQFESGDPINVTGFMASQNGCTVTMSLSDPERGTVTMVGPLTATGMWTASVSAPDIQYTANFTGTFSGGPPYILLTVISGSDSDGDTIIGGSGEITP
jgi:hypothetical protein